MKDTPVARFGINLAVVISFIGLAASALLMQHHVALEVGSNPLLPSVCEVTETASCDEVIASKWGSFEFTLGERTWKVPTAWAGYKLFAFALAWFLVIGRPHGYRRWLHWLPVILLFFGAIGCGLFAYVMYTQLDKWCPLCATTHVATGLLLIIALLLWPRRSRAERMQEEGQGDVAEQKAYPCFRLVLATVLFGAAISAAGWAEYQREILVAEAGRYKEAWQEYAKDTQLVYDKLMEIEPAHIPIAEGDPVRGPADAPHTIVVFSDFECPHCSRLARYLDERIAEHPDQFKMIFKHFPMDKACNPELKKTLHPAACAAAVATEIVLKEQGNEAFWRMHDLLFEDRERITAEYLFEVSEQVGVEEETVKSLLNTTSIWDRIKADVAQGRELGLTGTPALFLDGRRMKSWGDRHFWRHYVEHAEPSSATQPATSTAPASPLEEIDEEVAGTN